MSSMQLFDLVYQSGKSTWNTVSDGDSIAGDGLLPDCRYRKKDD